MTEPIGDIGARDQVEAAIEQLTHAVAWYYHRARVNGVPPSAALELVLQYQGYLLAMSAQAHEPR